jgi:hypothetical protein
MPTRDVNRAIVRALVRIRELRAGPEDEWIRDGDAAMDGALRLGASVRNVRLAAGLPVEPYRSGVVVSVADDRALVQLDDGEQRWLPAAAHTRVGAKLLVTEADLYPRDQTGL